MNFKTLVRVKTGNAYTNKITRIYVEGWIDNLAYFEEVVARTSRATIKESEFDGDYQVTGIPATKIDRYGISHIDGNSR